MRGKGGEGGRRGREGRKEMEGEWTLKNATKASSDKWFHSVFPNASGTWRYIST